MNERRNQHGHLSYCDLNTECIDINTKTEQIYQKNLFVTAPQEVIEQKSYCARQRL
jgi:hypothetical protein